MLKCVVIYNPNSGRLSNRNDVKKIYKILENYGYETEIKYTEYKGHAKEMTKSLKDVDLLLCAGGDGTLNEVISGNIERKKPILLGHLPLGSVNDVAHMYGMSNNTISNIAMLLNGKEKNIDVCLINNNPFVYIACMGYVNIYGTANPKSGSLEEPNSFTFDNNILFSTKTQLKRMNLPTYQYNDLTDGLIYTYYNYNDVVTISDDHTASISAIPGALATIRFNDQKKKAFYRIVLSRKENKFLRISKDELVRLQLICVNDTPEYGTEWDVNTYSVRNAEDLVIERK